MRELEISGCNDGMWPITILGVSKNFTVSSIRVSKAAPLAWAWALTQLSSCCFLHMTPLQVRKQLVGGSFMLLEADLAVKEKRAADLTQPLCMLHVAFTHHLPA